MEKIMKQIIGALTIAVGIQAPLAWAGQATTDSTTVNETMNVSGKWVVTPKTGNYGPSFAIGEVLLTQYGQNIEGIYMPSETQLDAINCTEGPYKVNGMFDGNDVKLTAVGPGSTLTGEASMVSGSLSGNAIEVFQNSRCSGAVSGKFIMKRI